MVMLDYKIRVARADDLKDLDALFGRAYPKLLKADYPPSVLVTSLPIISRAQPALLASGTFRVAELDDGRLISAGGWTPRRNTPELGDVRHVVTDDRFLRHGVARRLMGDCLADAAAQGVHVMTCQSTLTAVPFYRALGFETLGEMVVELPRGISFPAVRMQRVL